VLLAALSPSAEKYSLDLQPREEFSVFDHFLFCEKIAYFAKIETLRDSTHLFVAKDPGSSGRWLSPYLQIGKDNSASYPITRLTDERNLIDVNVYLGIG
jgi:hypothetical protein